MSKNVIEIKCDLHWLDNKKRELVERLESIKEKIRKNDDEIRALKNKLGLDRYDDDIKDITPYFQRNTNFSGSED